MIALTIYARPYYILEDLLDYRGNIDEYPPAHHPDGPYGNLAGGGFKYMGPMDFARGWCRKSYRGLRIIGGEVLR